MQMSSRSTQKTPDSTSYNGDVTNDVNVTLAYKMTSHMNIAKKMKTRKRGFYVIIAVLLGYCISGSTSKSIDKKELGTYRPSLKSYRDTPSTSPVDTLQLSDAYESETIPKLRHDHDLDTKCRTIYDSDKEALLTIQDAADSILKVIERMDIESRPSKPVSESIKVPHPYEAEKKVPLIQNLQKTMVNHLVNKKGFTITYNDKKSLEVIRTAAEEIKTQLLHLDMGERLTTPKLVASGTNNVANTVDNHHIKRNIRSLHRRDRGNYPKEGTGKQSDNYPAPLATDYRLVMNDCCKESMRELKNLSRVVFGLYTEIDDMGRKMREEYMDNSNLERTDIKSSSDNLKKLQGMLSATNHTLLTELVKVFNEQTKAHKYFENELKTVETIVMKLFLASADKKPANVGFTNKIHRTTKSIGVLENVKRDENEAVERDDDDADYDYYEDDDI